ncbi:hypothetical protein FA15DRAFT_685574 [Coprinopsis marcescibilis]|uniref:Uncharacterized protein n=1 Tax=Coprinopsis marcescibilis TaxID=230819 RepID=A0A5C3L5Y0_COPMA|nr:hypothetical protein FA15DRAFT_685574 [Coprinopsis marcescibilis]
MSVNPPSMTTHASQSLPSFAQAFSNQSLSNISSATNALPPIQARISTMDRDNGRPQQRSPPTPSLSRPASEENVARTAGRKRPHNDITSGSREEDRSDSDRASPAVIRMLDPSPSPPQRLSDSQRLGPGPSPSSATPAVKKRRMTITGAPHALNTDANSTPISPVEVEQLKSMMTQRRGSLAGPDRASNSAKTSVPSIPIRSARRSPNGGNPSSSQQSVQRPTSPNPSVFQSQQTQPLPHQSAHTLPPPPISFARRRAAHLGTKKKPADIVISPREQHSTERFQPSIHSAPPTQSAFYSGKASMALPRLPNIMGGGEVRRQPGNVPPTPTRLSQRMANSVIPPSITVSESTPRSPMASVAIASSLVPPTPAFNQSEFAGDKNAFLAPFSYFYDALNDAKQMKSWLGDQLQRSNVLFKSLQQQQDKLNEAVDTLVERKLSGVYSELTGLRRRVLELEDALQESRSGSRPSVDVSYHSKPQNGYLAPDSYTFPPDHSRQRSDNPSGRIPSPRGGGPHSSEFEYETSSASYDSRRGSVPASRLDAPSRSHPHDGTTLPPLMSSRLSHPVQSPPHMYQDRDNHSMHAKTSRAADRESEHPQLNRQQSLSGSSHDRDRGREREREREHRGESPPSRRVDDGRRNSVIMSPPDHRMEDS